MSFISKEYKLKTWVKVLKSIKCESTCQRIKVSCLILSKDHRIISTGWNGVPSGMKHCNDFPKMDSKNHHIFSEKYELHAEQNAICAASKFGISLNDSILLTSLSPCSTCAKLIIQTGIKEIWFLEEYDRSKDGIHLLNEFGIFCKKIPNDIDK